MPNKMHDRLSRRRFLVRAFIVSGTAASSPLLSACRDLSNTAGPGSAAKPTDTGSVAGARPGAPTSEAAAPVGPGAHPARAVAIGIYPGTIAQTVRDRVLPEFERDHGVKLIIEEGGTSDHLAKMQAQKENPQHIMLGVDDIAVSALRNEGLISRLDPREIPNLADVYPECTLEDGFGVGQGMGWITVWYNTERVKNAPTTYEAFWDPQYKGRVAVPTIKTTPGIQWLILSAALTSGKIPWEAQYHAEQGFEKWKQLKPSLHSMFDSFNATTPLLAQGEIWMTFGHSRTANYFILKGAPVERASVREGAFLGLNPMVLVKHPTLEPLGKDLINRLLSPDVQAELARVAQTGPVNKKAHIPPELKKLVPFGPEEARSMIRLDWNHVNKSRAAWVDRWNAEIAG